VAARDRGTAKVPGVLDISARIARLAAPSAHFKRHWCSASGVRTWSHRARRRERSTPSVRLRGELADVSVWPADPANFSPRRMCARESRYLSPNLTPATWSRKTRWTPANQARWRTAGRSQQASNHRTPGTRFRRPVEWDRCAHSRLVAADPHLLVIFGAHGAHHGLAAFYRHSPVGGGWAIFLADTRAEGNAQTDIRLTCRSRTRTPRG